MYFFPCNPIKIGSVSKYKTCDNGRSANEIKIRIESHFETYFYYKHRNTKLQMEKVRSRNGQKIT